MMGKVIIYWFRHDLRLADNLGLQHACRLATEEGAYLLPMFCHTKSQGVIDNSLTPWGFARSSSHRQHFLYDTLVDLRQQLQLMQLDLLEFDGELSEQIHFLKQLTHSFELVAIVCEDIVAPEEIAQVTQLRLPRFTAHFSQHFPVHSVWQSSMYDPSKFEFSLQEMPDQFTAFRHRIESAHYPIRALVDSTNELMLLGKMAAKTQFFLQFSSHTTSIVGQALFSSTPPYSSSYSSQHPEYRHQGSSFPYWEKEFKGGSHAAGIHLQRYFSSDLAHSYKQTRNQLSGVDFSTKFSPWLASGAISAVQIMFALRDFEQRKGQSDSSYWIWFELLWRDYFRFLHHKFGVHLYRGRGLSSVPIHLPAFDQAQFNRWSQGQTGEPLVDAAMRELNVTGYLSNRLRQQVASYWLHELEGDWRVGAAWFESQLLDFDVYSNQGNWLYLAGLGTDPRGYLGGRWFDVKKQTKQHDADGRYRQLWSAK